MSKPTPHGLIVCLVFFCNAVLHPQHKLQDFKNANWLLEWIDTAKNIVHEEFEHSYASTDVDGVVNPHSISIFICIFNMH